MAKFKKADTGMKFKVVEIVKIILFVLFAFAYAHASLAENITYNKVISLPLNYNESLRILREANIAKQIIYNNF